MKKLTAKAYAKLNLSLYVHEKRADGFHNLTSLMQSIGIFDTVSVTLGGQTPAKTGISITAPKVPENESNIACKAAKAFLEYTGLTANIHIDIEKRIPISAGLGGGSADGAAVILMLNKLLYSALPKEKLYEIGKSVGSDLPFCITGGTALVTGSGENIKPLPPLQTCHIVICTPPVEVLTKTAFRRLDHARESITPPQNPLTDTTSLAAVCANLYNDFAAFAPIPETTEILAQMQGFSPAGSGMSGSGPTAFAVFENASQANNCAAALNKSFPNTFLTAPCRSGADIC